MAGAWPPAAIYGALVPIHNVVSTLSSTVTQIRADTKLGCVDQRRLDVEGAYGCRRGSHDRDRLLGVLTLSSFPLRKQLG